MKMFFTQTKLKRHVAPVSAQANSRSDVKPKGFNLGGCSQNRRLQKGLPA